MLVFYNFRLLQNRHWHFQKFYFPNRNFKQKICFFMPFFNKGFGIFQPIMTLHLHYRIFF
jgi:hypothetical protein